MTIKVAAMCSYLTSIEVGWRPVDYAASNLVKAVKGKEISGTYSEIPLKTGIVKLRPDNAHKAMAWCAPWFVETLKREVPAGRVVLVPIPNKVAVNGYAGDYTTLRLAKLVAERAGKRVVVDDVLRWTKELAPAHEGG